MSEVNIPREVLDELEELAAELVQDHRGIPYDVIDAIDGIVAKARATPPSEEATGLAARIRESLDANNAFEYDDPTAGVMTGFDGNKDALAEAIAADLTASDGDFMPKFNPTPPSRPKHRMEWRDDVPTGWCECGKVYPHV